jgi:uncharacterized protein (DUF885 family)
MTLACSPPPRNRRGRSPLVLLALALAACHASGSDARARPPRRLSEQRILALADAFVAARFDRDPVEATQASWPAAAHDRLPDNSPAAIASWQARTDAWRAELAALPVPAPRSAAALARAVVLESLEAERQLRACRFHLWFVSPMKGWQAELGTLAAVQPVGTPKARADAVARLRALPRFLATEVENLREGARLGYVAPRTSVDRVLADLDALLAEPAATSSLALPARRDPDPAFAAALTAALESEALPAIRRYRQFLSEYRERARESVGVSQTPGGEPCYRAAVRSFTTLSMSPQEIHEVGARHLAAVEGEMRAIAARLFPGEALPAVLQRLRSDSRYTFSSREEILERARAAERRARARLPEWFGRVPRAELVVSPVPPFQERSALVSYVTATADGSRPGTVLVNPSEPEKQSRVALEAVSFHEGLPGHHLQLGLAVENTRLPAAARFLAFDGFVEGWALYAERLADEMGLYSSEVDRLGMLSWEALRAARLVVDTGIHAMGWSEARAIEFVLAHTSASPRQASAQVGRYIGVPGQATAYLLGMLEIRRLRAVAERALGTSFEVRAFHDRVLEHGSIPLPVLREEIEQWILTGQVDRWVTAGG